jgi:hypothetical protein
MCSTAHVPSRSSRSQLPFPPTAAEQLRPQPGSRLAEGHPQGRGLDPGEDGATLPRRGEHHPPTTPDEQR